MYRLHFSTSSFSHFFHFAYSRKPLCCECIGLATSLVGCYTIFFFVFLHMAAMSTNVWMKRCKGQVHIYRLAMRAKPSMASSENQERARERARASKLECGVTTILSHQYTDTHTLTHSHILGNRAQPWKWHFVSCDDCTSEPDTR